MKLKNLSEIPRLAMRPLHEFENITADHFIARALNAPIDSKNESIKGQPRTKGHEQIKIAYRFYSIKHRPRIKAALD